MAMRATFRATSCISLLPLIVGLSVFSREAVADGLFLPPQAVEAMPSIPAQRAALFFFDGQEELIIESDFTGEGSEFAWIVPSPAAPTCLGQAEPDYFERLRGNMPYPITIYGPTRILPIAAFLMIWAIFLLSVGPHGRSFLAPLRGFIFAAVYVFSVLYYILVFSNPATLGSFGPPSLAGEPVTVLESTVIGNYEVSVLDAESPEALRGWLDAKGFHSLDARGDAIVQAYLDEDWVFTAAKLRRAAEGGFARPHPIALRFPAESPVYPMRLTQLAGGDLHLDLYIFAAERAMVSGLKTNYCDKHDDWRDTSLDAKRLSLAPEWASRSVRSGVFTHLSANLDNAQLDQDYPITFRSYAPAHAAVWLPRGLRWTIVEWSLLVFSVPFLLGALWRYWLRKNARPRRGFFVFVLIGTALVPPVVYYCYTYCQLGVEIDEFGRRI